MFCKVSSKLAVRRLATTNCASLLLLNRQHNANAFHNTQRRFNSTSANGGNVTNNTNSKAAASNEDDDFVGIMFPGDEDHPNPSSSSSSSSNTGGSDIQPDDDDEGIVLGVQRDEPLRDDQYLTRLGVKATKPAEEEVRMGTRAATLQGKRNSQSELAQRSGEGDDEMDDDDEDSYIDENGLLMSRAAMPEEDTFTPDEELASIDLPYDAEEFAEAILQMEVEGQLDESWQNGRVAKKEDCIAIADILRHMKARDIACIDVSAKTSSFDFMIFATCEGPRHVHLCSWSVSRADKESRISKPKRKTSDRTWECVPVGRIVVNLMTETQRHSMSFERKWAVTKNMDPLDHAHASTVEGRVVKSHGLWTLTLNLQDLEDFEVDYCKDALLAQL